MTVFRELHRDAPNPGFDSALEIDAQLWSAVRRLEEEVKRLTERVESLDDRWVDELT